MFEPTQTLLFPVIVGFVLTVMVCVIEHPKLLVYVIVVVPGLIAVTNPIFETLATKVLLEVQELLVAAVPEPVI